MFSPLLIDKNNLQYELLWDKNNDLGFDSEPSKDPGQPGAALASAQSDQSPKFTNHMKKAKALFATHYAQVDSDLTWQMPRLLSGGNFFYNF